MLRVKNSWMGVMIFSSTKCHSEMDQNDKAANQLALGSSEMDKTNSVCGCSFQNYHREAFY